MIYYTLHKWADIVKCHQRKIINYNFCLWLYLQPFFNQ